MCNASIRRGKELSAIIRPNFSYKDWIRLQGTYSTDKLYNYEVEVDNFVKDTKFFITKLNNGKENALFFKSYYQNATFGELGLLFSFPHRKNSFITFSTVIEREELKGFGGAASLSFLINDKTIHSASLLGFYKHKVLELYGGLNHQEEATKLHGGINYTFNNDYLQYLAQLSLNLADFDYSAEVGISIKLCEMNQLHFTANTDGYLYSKFSSNLNDHFDGLKADFVGGVDIWEQAGRLGAQLSCSI